MVTPVEPEAPEPGPPAGHLLVERGDVAGIRSGVRTILVIVVMFGLLLGWTQLQNERTEERQDATDERLDGALDDLEAANERIEALIQERADEASRAAAVDCVQGHVRYELLRQTLEVLADTDAEAEEALAIFPALSCDLGEAEAELAGG